MDQDAASSSQRRGHGESESPAEFHQVSAAAVLAALGSQAGGLTTPEAARRRASFGPNRLETAHPFRSLRLFAKQFFNFFSLLLYAAAASCFIAERIQPGEGMAVMGWALAAVAIMNAVFAFTQEMRAERAMDELRKFLPQTVACRRSGAECSLVAEDLVPGDIVLLNEGDRIAADVRLIEANELLLDNAPLTGESRSRPASTAAVRTRFIDSSNIAFAGCTVVRGNGVGVVVATGHATEFGKIAALSRDIRRPQSPIERETTRMIRVLTAIAVVMGGAFFAYGVASGRSLWINIVFMLGIIVANVPEGLLPTFTLALSMAGVRMAKKRVLVKSLAAVEALGAVHVICTDKTGTLTQNRLTIAEIVGMDGRPYGDAETLRACLRSALIASEIRSLPAHADRSLGKRWTGDPLDVVIAERFAEYQDPTAIMSRTRRHFPFDLQKRREAGLFADETDCEFAVKGAWESLRPMIGGAEQPGGRAVVPATPELLDQCEQVVHRLSCEGLRVVAVAYRPLATAHDEGISEGDLERGLVLRGFLALADPIREEVPAAVTQCHGLEFA